MAITYTKENTVDFNITLSLGKDNKEVTIYAEDLNNIPTKGIHFKLPDDTTVDLGSLQDFIEWLNVQIKDAKLVGDVTIPSEAGDDWPEQIKDIFNGILTAKMEVTKLALDQEPRDAENNYPPLDLDLAVTGTAVGTDGKTPQPIPIIRGSEGKGLFSVVGGGIGLSRTHTESTTAN